MGEYDSAIALAKRLIEKKGQPVSLYQVGEGTASDADKPWKLDGGDASDTLLISGVKAVVFDPREARGFFGQFSFEVELRGGSDGSDDSLIANATAIALIAAASLGSVVPKSGNLLTLGSGQRLVVVRTDPLSPGGTPVLYTLHLKE